MQPTIRAFGGAGGEVWVVVEQRVADIVVLGKTNLAKLPGDGLGEMHHVVVAIGRVVETAEVAGEVVLRAVVGVDAGAEQRPAAADAVRDEILGN